MKLFIKCISIHLQSHMQYKFSFFLIMLGQFIASFTAYLGIYFMFSRFNEVEGFTYEQVLLCYAVVLMSYSLADILGSGFLSFPGMLSNGEFDRALVRPRSVITQIPLMKMDFTRLGLLVQAIFMICYALNNNVVIWTWDKVLTLCLMIVCGSILFFFLFLVNASFCFFTIEGVEIMNIFTHGARQFGRYPYSIYGQGVLRIVTYVIPLALFQYYPLLYLLDIEQNILYMFLPVIGLLFVIPCYVFFRFGLHHYKSIGS